MPYRYLQRVAARRYNDTGADVQRGLQAGEQIGKLIGGLAGAIKSAQMDSAANKLMNTQNAPRAALVSPGFQRGGPQPAGGDEESGPGATQNLGTLPDTTFTNPSTGNAEPLQGQDDQMTLPDTSGGGGPTAGSLADKIAAAKIAAALPGARVPNVIPEGVSTAGTAPFSGGVEGMKLQEAFRKSKTEDQLSALKIAAAQRQATLEQEEESGTGRFALEAATKRAQLAKSQAELAEYGKPKKDAPAENIGSEPVTDQGQLNRHIDGIYGTGTANDIAATLNAPETITDTTDPNNPVDKPNPNRPVVRGSSVEVGPEKHRITLSISEAQTYAKQANALRIKQGLPAYVVPGEDQTVGATPGNPYIARNNLDVYSRAPGVLMPDGTIKGGWVRLPNGKIAQVPPRRR